MLVRQNRVLDPVELPSKGRVSQPSVRHSFDYPPSQVSPDSDADGAVLQDQGQTPSTRGFHPSLSSSARQPDWPRREISSCDKSLHSGDSK